MGDLHCKDTIAKIIFKYTSVVIFRTAAAQGPLTHLENYAFLKTVTGDLMAGQDLKMVVTLCCPFDCLETSLIAGCKSELSPCYGNGD